MELDADQRSWRHGGAERNQGATRSEYKARGCAAQRERHLVWAVS